MIVYIHISRPGIKVHVDSLAANCNRRDEFNIALDGGRANSTRLIGLIDGVLVGLDRGGLEVERLKVIQSDVAEVDGRNAKLAEGFAQRGRSVSDIITALDTLDLERPAFPGRARSWCSQCIKAQGEEQYKRKKELHLG